MKKELSRLARPKIALRTHMISIELWPVKPTLCYYMSRNPQVFLTVAPLTTIYFFEDINWSKDFANFFSSDKLRTSLSLIQAL